MDIVQQINEVTDINGFISTIRMLSGKYQEDPQRWENRTIDDYLESIASWVEDFSACPNDDVDWESVDYRLILRLLYMGGIYE